MAVEGISPMSASNADISEENQLRANVYSLLGALIAASPSVALIELLQAIEKHSDVNEAGMHRAWQVLRLAAERADLESLGDEYHDLFIGVGRGELMPYGSWYMTGFLMDQPVALLRKDLANLGFERQQGIHESEDHVGSLCEVMSMILTSGTEVSEDKQKQFFEQHIAPWMGKFFSDLKHAKKAHFYKAVGDLGENFIEVEKQYLAMRV